MNACSAFGHVPGFITEKTDSALPVPPFAASPKELAMKSGLDFREDFFGYVQRSKAFSNVDFAEAQKLVKEGKTFLQGLREGGFKDCSREEGRALIIPLMWYLMARAFEKKSGFLEGMIVLEDPEHLVADFFSQFGSKRLSSHYSGRVIGSSFGIDQPTKLPCEFRTVLFGKLLVPAGEREWTFFKPETYGTESLCELVPHGWSYCLYQFKDCLGIDAGPLDRKEEIVPPLAEKIQKLIEASIVDKKIVKQWGIAGVFRALSPLLQSPENSFLPQDKQRLICQFFSDATARYDWLPIRCGDEVVLSYDEREDANRDRLQKASVITSKQKCIA